MKWIRKTCYCLFLFAVLSNCSGCASYHVSRMGRISPDVDYVPRYAARTSNAAVVVEMQLVKRDLGMPVIVHRNMGTRYLLYKDTNTVLHISSLANRGKVTSWYNQSGHLQIAFVINKFVISSNAGDLCITPEWYLYPPDTGTIISDAKLPLDYVIDRGTRVRFKKEQHGPWQAALPDLPIAIEKSAFSYYNQKNVGSYYHLTGKEETVGWARGASYVLFIPALVLDIVTSPFQLIYAIAEFADGMSALGGH